MNTRSTIRITPAASQGVDELNVATELLTLSYHVSENTDSSLSSFPSSNSTVKTRKRRPLPNNKYTNEQREQIAKMYLIEGKKPIEIERELNFPLTANYVYQL